MCTGNNIWIFPHHWIPKSRSSEQRRDLALESSLSPWTLRNSCGSTGSGRSGLGPGSPRSWGSQPSHRSPPSPRPRWARDPQRRTKCSSHPASGATGLKYILSWLAHLSKLIREHWNYKCFQMKPSNQCVADTGCLSWIPDTNFFHPGSASKNLSNLTQNIGFQAHPRSRSQIRILTFYPSRIPDPGSRGQKGTWSWIRNTASNPNFLTAARLHKKRCVFGMI